MMNIIDLVKKQKEILYWFEDICLYDGKQDKWMFMYTLIRCIESTSHGHGH